jgi:hypothetical protein
MAQHDYIISNATFPALRTDLNNALSAIQTTNSGTSRPTGAVAGQLWLDTTSATTPTLKYYDGADDISLATIDHTANTVNWLDSTVSITGLSTTATGTVLTLSDSANTTTVNLIIDNQKEVRFRETTANGTNYIGLKAPASVSSDLTFTLPATDGTSGQVLQTNGSGVLSFVTVTADGTADWDTTVKTSGFTATANKGYFCNTTSAGFTVTLPATPSAGDEVILVDYAGTWDTNSLAINPNSNKILGQTSNVNASKDREAFRLVYIDTTQGWIPYSGYQESTAGLLIPYSIDFLVIAGGGGSGIGNGGGAGAGGYRTSTQSVSNGTVITVTVGDGGAGGNPATNGSYSSISGSGLTTITSAGGGAGGTGGASGANGGSGGGSGNGGVGAGGTGNTPSTSPSQGNNGGSGTASTPPYFSTGGGGGASAVGANGTTTTSGNGGNGTASSITGSSVTRAGGGGGSISTGTAGSGGTGGGGNGGVSVAGTNGTANTGGGAGGTSTSGSGANGGKGVVILSVPTTNYSSTTTGSPTVTTSGSNTIMQFNGSGSYTA